LVARVAFSTTLPLGFRAKTWDGKLLPPFSRQQLPTKFVSLRTPETGPEKQERLFEPIPFRVAAELLVLESAEAKERVPRTKSEILQRTPKRVRFVSDE